VPIRFVHGLLSLWWRGGSSCDVQEDRVAKLNRLAELEAEEATLSSQIAVHKENDPAILKVLEAKRAVAKQAADRWTGVQSLA
jgi:hypothetical protein